MDAQKSTIVFSPKTAPSAFNARIGFILLNSDEVGEGAFQRVMPDDVAVYTTRTAYSHAGGEFTTPTSFTEIASTLPPSDRFDVLAFSCTSGTVALGIPTLLHELEQACPGVKYTSPGIAMIEALRHVEAKRVALLTPYGYDFHQKFLPFLASASIHVAADGVFDCKTDIEICELDVEEILIAAKALVTQSAADALFLSCTAMPVVPHLARFEQELGIPVMSSSQALAWHALKLSKYAAPISGFGRLLDAQRA
ncbi:aspartate/glutamate racemase family protein [Mesorhizobium sp.]|uniref:maleate cis-trans isomerase family protein n=1 Tax=Mesorhizobium sp. TaxID=1871066 RepID=UPI00257DD385|nr:aspartate/glutamate racemase family protein [Mesorhizobium sp.]